MNAAALSRRTAGNLHIAGRPRTGVGSSPLYKQSFRAVVLDDDAAFVEFLTEVARRRGFDVTGHTSLAAALVDIEGTRPDLVLLDVCLPGRSRVDALEQIGAISSQSDVILVTDHSSIDSVVLATKKGAYDYLTKPVEIGRLEEKLGTWMREATERLRAIQVEQEVLSAIPFSGLVGRSPAMLEALSKLRRVAPFFQTALITGDTGTGKEVVARVLHDMSPRRNATFAVCNCASIVETLFESELFGYVRGAFTGAVQDKPGLFEYANGGTLLLDEIGEMPLSTQAKLLRAVQSREVQRLGSPAVFNVDVHIIAATNRDLRRMVEEGRFREDLYYRLAVVEVKLPRLAERKEDLLLLARHFLDKYGEKYAKGPFSLTRKAELFIARHHWPGNVRELENVLSYSCMVAQSDAIDIIDFPESVFAGAKRQRQGADYNIDLSLDEVMRRHAGRVLASFSGNRVRAAKSLGISRATLYRLVPRNGNLSE